MRVNYSSKNSWILFLRSSLFLSIFSSCFKFATHSCWSMAFASSGLNCINPVNMSRWIYLYLKKKQIVPLNSQCFANWSDQCWNAVPGWGPKSGGCLRWLTALGHIRFGCPVDPLWSWKQSIGAANNSSIWQWCPIPGCCIFRKANGRFWWWAGLSGSK